MLSGATLTGVVAAILVAACLVAFAMLQAVALAQRWRERQAVRRARGTSSSPEPTAHRVEAAMHATLRAFAPREPMKRTGARVDDLSEPEWIALLAMAPGRGKARALAAAGRSRKTDAGLAALKALEAALTAHDGPGANQASRALALHLGERHYEKAALIQAAYSALMLRNACAAYDLADAQMNRLRTMACDLGCAPARMLSDLFDAQRALDRRDLTGARQALNEANADLASAPIEAQIAAADLESHLAEFHGNFARARAELERRASLEGRAARSSAQTRAAQAHRAADLARVELIETRHTTGKRMRASGRRAQRLLRKSAGTFLAASDAGALALAYTRMAMAAVLQHQLNAAQRWATRGRRMAENVGLADLAVSADDLLRRIDAERQARRDWLSAFVR